jgi:hypothetical protein
MRDINEHAPRILLTHDIDVWQKIVAPRYTPEASWEWWRELVDTYRERLTVYRSERA